MILPEVIGVSDSISVLLALCVASCGKLYVLPAALRARSLGFASFLREKTTQASESLKQRDWTREQQALTSLRIWGTG